MVPNILPQKDYFPKVLPQKLLISNGWKNILTSWPQQFWAKWAAFRPALHTKIPMAPNILPQEFFPKSSSPKIINIEWVQKIPDIMALAILRKMGSISPSLLSHQQWFPKKSSPRILPHKSFPPNSLTSHGCKKILTSLKLNNYEKKRAAFRPVYQWPQKVFPKTLFPKNYSA